MSSIDDLLALAVQIRDETNPGANSAFRVGELLVDIVETLQQRTPPGYAFNASNNFLTISNLAESHVEGFFDIGEMTFNLFQVIEPFPCNRFIFYNYTGISSDSIEFALYSRVANINFDIIPESEVTYTDLTADAAQTIEFSETIILEPGIYAVALTPNDAFAPAVVSSLANTTILRTVVTADFVLPNLYSSAVVSVADNTLPEDYTLINGDRSSLSLFGHLFLE